MPSDPVTAETAALAKQAELLASTVRKAMVNAQQCAAEIRLRECDHLAMAVVEIADVVDDLARLVQRVTQRMQAIESQQIGKALTARAECPRDMDHHD